MLCDSIIGDAVLPAVYVGFEPIKRKIEAAQKFVIAPDFAAAGDGLTDNYTEIERIVPFCRLPYRLCWFELAQADRPHFLNSPKVIGGHITRLGFLAEATDRMSHWKLHLFWSMKENPSSCNASVMAMVLDTEGNRAKLAASRGFVFQEKLPRLMNATCVDLADFGQNCWINATRLGEEKQLALSCREDWAAEIRFFVAMLGLLNARNVTEAQTIDNTEYNRKRAKRGSPPLSSHTVLKIRTAHKSSLGVGRKSDEPSEIRAHFVRGHFKQRSTGLFWWGPHMRGKLERGFVAKDYEVAR